MVNLSTTDKRITETSDMGTALLIIGKGESEYKNKEIVKCVLVEDVEYLYGADSDLTYAFKEAYALGARNIYLCNCYLFTDYINVLGLIASTEFAYITPLFNFSETYETNLNKEVYLCELYSNIIGDKLTQLIFTDKHASLYEGIEQYLDEMNSINSLFKQSSKDKIQYGDNFCFVLNCLKKYNFANVALASILMQSDLKYYPQMDIGDVVYDINNFDIYGQEIIYFAYDTLAKTSIENFLNFRTQPAPEKFVPIHLIIQKIKRELDFSEFSGTLFTSYMQIKIENKVNKIMSNFVEVLIESYKILKINYTTTNDHRIIVYIYLSVKPYNSIEEINVTLEV
jgi:hypothetical protein